MKMSQNVSTDNKLSFLCFGTKKKYHSRKMASMLEVLGDVRWCKVLPLSFCFAPQGAQRGRNAIKIGKIVRAREEREAKSRLKLWIDYWLYRFQYNAYYSFFKKNPHKIAAVFGAGVIKNSRRSFLDAVVAVNCKFLFFEWAPFPGCLTVDPRGVNFISSLPREIESYKAWYTKRKSSSPKGVWKKDPSPLKSKKHDYHENNLALALGKCPPLQESFLFVPLQLQKDTQICLFGRHYKTITSFLYALCEATKNLPSSWHVRIKDHPLAQESATSFIESIKGDLPIYVDNVTDTFEQVKASRGVITINSSVGLQAMFFDKPVIVCGEAFWDIEGVALSAPRLHDLQVFLANPEALSYDAEVREVFMTYLDEVYYISYERLHSENPEIRNHEIRKIFVRLGLIEDETLWIKNVS